MRATIVVRSTLALAWIATTASLAAFTPAGDFAARLRAAQSLMERGEYTGAERLLSGLLKETGPPPSENLEKSAVLSDLGWVYHMLGDDLKSESCLRRALGMQAGILGATHPQTVRATVNRAIVYIESDQVAKADRLGLRALLDRRAEVSEDDSDWARLLTTLGAMERRRGRYAQAVSY